MPGVKWVGGITYIRTWEKVIYLVTVTGCCTKKVGWVCGGRSHALISGDAIDRAVRKGSTREEQRFSIRIEVASTVQSSFPDI